MIWTSESKARYYAKLFYNYEIIEKNRKLLPRMKTRTTSIPFTPAKDATTEYHIMIRVTDPSLDYISQLASVLQAGEEAAEGKVVRFRRFFRFRFFRFRFFRFFVC